MALVAGYDKQVLISAQQAAQDASNTVPVVIVLIDWGLWDIFWVFWIVAAPVALLIWIVVWALRRYNRDLKAREKMYEPPKDKL